MKCEYPINLTAPSHKPERGHQLSPVVRLSTLGIDQQSSQSMPTRTSMMIHFRNIIFTLNEERGSNEARSSCIFEGRPAHVTSLSWPFRRNAIKSLPPLESGT